MFIEIRKIKRLQKDGTRTCHAKQWPTPPSRNAGATPLEAKPRMTDEAKARAKKELEGRTGDTDSEAEGSEGLDDA